MSANYKEKETRREKINKMLENCGWEILKKGQSIPKNGTFASEEYTTVSGDADYALFIDGDAVGIVEAKKSGEPVYGVLPQAQRYARDIQGTNYDFNGFKVPFIYSTNGQDVYFQDLR